VRTLITGGAGFLGGHLVERLRGEGLDPVIARKAGHDLTSSDQTAELFEKVRPELVFHLAAEVGGIGANRANPGRYWYANLAMGLNVLEQCRVAKVDKLVMTGTICSYPKFSRVPFEEESLWDGYPEETNAPYGVAKKTLLVGAQAYRAQYGLNTVVLLPVNLYGPRDNFDPDTSHVIPALIRKMIEARNEGAGSVTLWGDGTPTREFLYVEDCAEALWLAAQRYDGADPVNIGTGEEISINMLAEMVATAVGFTGEMIWDPTKPNGQPRRRISVERAAERFGFRAGTSLEEGIARTVIWARTHDTGVPPVPTGLRC
jgi:GDP-L-fucose synthase